MRAAFSRIDRVPAYRKLADAIMEQILDGRLREGDPLPTEARLCEMFGVNRSTVREGIRVLEEANMLRRENNAKRMYISHPSREETGAQVERALMLNEISFGELLEAMLIIEPTMARLAAEKLDQSILARIDKNLEMTELAVKNGDPLVFLDIEFHGLVATMSANRALNLARDPISRLFYLSFRAVMAGVSVAKKRLLEAHLAIADAIRGENAEEAEIWMRKHIRDFKYGLDLAGVNVDMPIGSERAKLLELKSSFVKLENG